MANYRRSHGRHSGRAAREKSSDYRYPQIARGTSERSAASTRRRLAAADPTPIKRVWTAVPDGIDIEYIVDYVEI